MHCWHKTKEPVTANHPPVYQSAPPTEDEPEPRLSFHNSFPGSTSARCSLLKAHHNWEKDLKGSPPSPFLYALQRTVNLKKKSGDRHLG